jgi:hypothetical protein
MEIVKNENGFVLHTEQKGDIGLPEYPSDNDSANAIILSMIDLLDSNLSFNLICEVVVANSKMSACIGLMPYYCKYYSQKDNIDFQSLKEEVNKLILEAKMSGMLN